MRGLQYLKETEGQLASWALKLQAYCFEILQRPGASIQNTDRISQLPMICTIVSTANELYSKMVCNEFSDEPYLVQNTLIFLKNNTFLEFLFKAC